MKLEYVAPTPQPSDNPGAALGAARLSPTPWGRLGLLAKVSPGTTLFKSIVDPLVVAAVYLLLCLAHYGRLGGLDLSIAVVAFLLAGYLFDGSLLFLPDRRRGRDVLAMAAGWLLLVGIMLLLGRWSGLHDYVETRLVIEWAILTPLCLLAVHVGTLFALLHGGSARAARRAVIVGATPSGQALAQEMARQPWLRFELLGYFDDRPAERTGVPPEARLGPLSALADYVREHKVRGVYITLPLSSQPRVLELLAELSDTTASIYFMPDLFVYDTIQAQVDHIGGLPLLSVCESPFFGVGGVLKRASDCVLAAIALLLLWPVMLAVALAVKLTSPGPVIFRQKRYGLDGEEILVYKFRSMTVQDNGPVVQQATRNDPRLTPIGGFLRRSSLDELPQFLNVLQGRMSVVGPRPHANAHNEQYRKLIRGYMVRHKARPGITGWAQVNGFRGETDTLDKMEGRVAFDLDYLRNWNLWLDLRIIVRTARMMVGGDKAAY
ncbi:undecaprenyl-phosphate glucose phosphotransferase [Chitinimonas koreensis]|uniref:undecaprenyl-phosphate glucose phosphotransferase n=1 Tax=Chitinimonas koreensis TaxID=356302 RepID=UPI000A04E154|nr:undecaprenyl-phosphate glucose phosphotransferase [Chitinimonas koreensis]QNM95055.1 undecaprenyl-phosphate glucose phosphotransferase [Chitinimonas koreensis]